MMKSLLKLLSGLTSAIFRRRPRANQYGLTAAQLAVKVDLDDFLDSSGTGIKAFWGPRRSGKTYLAHVIHRERPGVVVVRSRAAADEFRREHARMFGEDARVATTDDLRVFKGWRGGAIITDVQPHCANVESEAAHIHKVISLRA